MDKEEVAIDEEFEGCVRRNVRSVFFPCGEHLYFLDRNGKVEIRGTIFACGWMVLVLGLGWVGLVRFGLVRCSTWTD